MIKLKTELQYCFVEHTCSLWKLYPVRQSHKNIVPLSPPLTNTPSGFTAMQLTIALWPERFCINFPSGHFHCLILSGDAEANVYNVGWMTIERTDFLWFVNVQRDLPAARSHRRIVESCEPVIICKNTIQVMDTMHKSTNKFYTYYTGPGVNVGQGLRADTNYEIYSVCNFTFIFKF